MNLKSLIIGAPFGNYIHRPYVTSTLGTFTLLPRPGRLKQVLKTVRYSWVLDAWVNKIGLRNPGIDSLKNKDVSDKIVSIHGFNTEEWMTLLEHKIRECTPGASYYELNFSCPNVVDKPLDYVKIFRFASLLSKTFLIKFIVKIPPVEWHKIFDIAAGESLSYFHCCNTLPVHCGGMSGAPLKQYSIKVCRTVRRALDEAFIIGGGGIKTRRDVYDYADAGVNRVAIASALFNPITLFFRLKNLSEYAKKMFPIG